MGQTLSEPVVVKHTDSGSDDRMAFGVSEMQGWRLTMEDAHSTILDLDEGKVSSSSTPLKQRRSFFAVYDGHGGSTVAKFAGDTVYERLKGTDEFKSKDYKAALKRTFLATDEDLLSNVDFQGDPSGCTAVAVLITEDGKLICANAGDSRAILCVGGEAKPMSHDHKPVNKEENARIVAAGGFVEFGRVNGNLALSRALGDFEFKKSTRLPAEEQVVTADPDIIEHEPTDEDEFLVIACDGIWDVMTSQNVADVVRRKISERVPLDKICEEMMDRCLAPDADWGGVGCDNMTILVVALLHGRTLDQWYDWVGQRCENGTGYETPLLSDVPDAFKQGGPGGHPGPQGGAGRGGRVAPRGGGAAGRILLGQGSEADEDDGYGGRKVVYQTDEEEEEDEASLLSNLQAALRREGIQVVGGADQTSSITDMDADEKPTSSEGRNDEMPSGAVKAEGLSDKSEDPTRTLA